MHDSLPKSSKDYRWFPIGAEVLLILSSIKCKLDLLHFNCRYSIYCNCFSLCRPLLHIWTFSIRFTYFVLRSLENIHCPLFICLFIFCYFNVQYYIPIAFLYIVYFISIFLLAAHIFVKVIRIWRILQVEEGVIHWGRRRRWITPSDICRIFKSCDSRIQ